MNWRTVWYTKLKEHNHRFIILQSTWVVSSVCTISNHCPMRRSSKCHVPDNKAKISVRRWAHARLGGCVEVESEAASARTAKKREEGSTMKVLPSPARSNTNGQKREPRVRPTAHAQAEDEGEKVLTRHPVAVATSACNPPSSNPAAPGS